MNKNDEIPQYVHNYEEDPKDIKKYNLVFDIDTWMNQETFEQEEKLRLLKIKLENDKKTFLEYKEELESLVKNSIKEGLKKCTITQSITKNSRYNTTFDENLGFAKSKATKVFLFQMKKKEYPITTNMKKVQVGDDPYDGSCTLHYTRTIVISLGKLAKL